MYESHASLTWEYVAVSASITLKTSYNAYVYDYVIETPTTYVATGYSNNIAQDFIENAPLVY